MDNDAVTSVLSLAALVAYLFNPAPFIFPTYVSTSVQMATPFILVGMEQLIFYPLRALAPLSATEAVPGFFASLATMFMATLVQFAWPRRSRDYALIEYCFTIFLLALVDCAVLVETSIPKDVSFTGLRLVRRVTQNSDQAQSHRRDRLWLSLVMIYTIAGCTYVSVPCVSPTSWQLCIAAGFLKLSVGAIHNLIVVTIIPPFSLRLGLGTLGTSKHTPALPDDTKTKGMDDEARSRMEEAVVPAPSRDGFELNIGACVLLLSLVLLLTHYNLSYLFT